MLRDGRNDADDIVELKKIAACLRMEARRSGRSCRRRSLMKDLIRLTDLQASEVYEIFNIADEISAGKYQAFLNGKSAILFFPCFQYPDTGHF